MKKVVLILLVLILAIGGYYWYMFSKAGGNTGPKQQAIALKKHSEQFNHSISNAMNAYFDMKAAFVEADTAGAKDNCRKFISLLDSIPLIELKNDSAKIYDVALNDFSNIKANAESLLKQSVILEMRKDFGMVSENLYPFFRTIFCPSSFLMASSVILIS